MTCPPARVAARAAARRCLPVPVVALLPCWADDLDCGEYARHNGHADLLRESIDGVTGR